MVEVTSKNPFYVNRWEDEQEHLFWLPPVFDKLEENRCIFLIGTRGAGKTTMLKALDWRERLSNKSLQNHIRNTRGEEIFSKRFIGIYIDLGKQYVLDSFYSHLRSENLSPEEIEYMRGSRFSQYIEYLAIYDLIEAIDSLRMNGHIRFTPEQEQNTVRKIYQMRPELAHFFNTNDDIPILDDVKVSVKHIYEHIWNDSVKGSTGGKFNLPSLQIGLVLGELSKSLLSLCGMEDEKWAIKVCIDSIENLNSYQQKALNTLIAAQKEHTTFVFASTHENIDLEATFISNHPLTHDDRGIIKLDDYYEERNGVNFGDFAAEVTRLRFERLLGTPLDEVDLGEILGRPTINALLDYELSNTVSPKLLHFKEFVINDFQIKWNSLLQSVNKKERSVPPYVEAYVTKEMQISLDEYFGRVNEFNALNKKFYEKRRVMAMLCLLYEAESGRDASWAPYAGYNMVIRMSDSNIRDFLRQMNYIYKLSPNKGEAFLKNTVPIELQKSAINSASESKYAEITYESSYASDIKNLVTFLGKVTHGLHTNGRDALRNPERGLFVIDYTKIKDKKEGEDLVNIIHRAHVIKYYIKVKNTQKDSSSAKVGKQKIQLHRLFAPYFKFSYREPDTGPQHEINLNPNTLVKICVDPEANLAGAVKRTIEESSTIEKAQTTFTDW